MVEDELKKFFDRYELDISAQNHLRALIQKIRVDDSKFVPLTNEEVEYKLDSYTRDQSPYIAWQAKWLLFVGEDHISLDGFQTKAMSGNLDQVHAQMRQAALDDLNRKVERALYSIIQHSKSA